MCPCLSNKQRKENFNLDTILYTRSYSPFQFFSMQNVLSNGRGRVQIITNKVRLFLFLTFCHIRIFYDEFHQQIACPEYVETIFKKTLPPK